MKTGKLLLDENIAGILAENNGRNVVVSSSVSGGKDSGALAILVEDHLRGIGFTGKHVLIHSDLGEIEHTDSLPVCRELAEHLGIELITVHPLRDMLTRWEYRWECNVKRFAELRTVKIATWASSATWRFCTSEEKTAPICRTLKKTFPGRVILNAVGIRGEESSSRAKKPVSALNTLLKSKKENTIGYTWFPIRDLQIEDVFTAHKSSGFRLHEAYSNGNTRVSCVFCVLAGETDLRASLKDHRTHAVYQRLAALEAATTFSFQPEKWLADLAPQLLPTDLREAITNAKQRAIVRNLAERQIPREMLFNKATGFPEFQPSITQSEQLAGARLAIADALQIEIGYTTTAAVYQRYQQLLDEKERKSVKSPAVVEKEQASLF